MNKKIGLLIFLVLILTGCKANYVLEYENGTFTEHLEFISSADTYIEDEGHPSYEALKENNVSAVNDGSEKWSVDHGSSKYDIKISHTLENTTLNDITLPGECFAHHTYKENNNTIYYSAFGDFSCDYLDEGSTFTLVTSAKVLDSNATSKENNKYIWDLSDEKVRKDGISFQILKESKEKDMNKNRSADLIPWYVKFIISIIFIAVIMGTVIYMRNRS